jgi:hypothetical protein
VGAKGLVIQKLLTLLLWQHASGYKRNVESNSVDPFFLDPLHLSKVTARNSGCPLVFIVYSFSSLKFCYLTVSSAAVYY